MKLTLLTTSLILSTLCSLAQNKLMKGKWQIKNIQLVSYKGNPNFVLNDTTAMLSELLRSYKLEQPEKQFTQDDTLKASDEIKSFYEMRNAVLNYDGTNKFEVFMINDKKILVKGTYTYDLKQKKLVTYTKPNGKLKTEIATATIVGNVLYISNRSSKTNYELIN